MDKIEIEGTEYTMKKQRRTKRLAYFLLLYIVVVTVAVIWLTIKVIK